MEYVKPCLLCGESGGGLGACGRQRLGGGSLHRRGLVQEQHLRGGRSFGRGGRSGGGGLIRRLLVVATQVEFESKY